jgi:excisionase family DNA binding protein
MFLKPKENYKSIPANNYDKRQSLLTAAEVAKYLRVSKKTVYRLVASGELPAARVRRMMRFAKEDVSAFLDDLRGGTKHRK